MKSEGVNVQCQKCGTIFQVDEQNDYFEYAYIHAECPCCKHEGNMLNIGKTTKLTTEEFIKRGKIIMIK